MKITCGFTVIVLFVVVNYVTSKSSEQYVHLMLEKAADCRKETNATDRDIQEMADGLLPTTRTARCLNACILNKFGAMNEEKLVPEKLAQLISEEILKLKGNDGKTLKEVLKDIAKECEMVSVPDKCDSAFEISSCFMIATKKRGFDKPIF